MLCFISSTLGCKQTATSAAETVLFFHDATTLSPNNDWSKSQPRARSQHSELPLRLATAQRARVREVNSAKSQHAHVLEDARVWDGRTVPGGGGVTTVGYCS